MATFFLCCYWKFKLPHCLWLRYLWRIYATYIFLIESTGSVRRCFRSEHESDNPVPRVLSRVCVNECTTQGPFCNNELCRFHIRQAVWVLEKWLKICANMFPYLKCSSMKPWGKGSRTSNIEDLDIFKTTNITSNRSYW